MRKPRAKRIGAEMLLSVSVQKPRGVYAHVKPCFTLHAGCNLTAREARDASTWLKQFADWNEGK